MKDGRAHTLGSAPSGPAIHPRLHTRPKPLELRALRALLTALGSPPLTVELWTGATVSVRPETSAVATLVIRDRGALWGLLWHPELSFGDLYATGRVDVSGDLVEALVAATASLSESGWLQKLSRLLDRIRPRPANSRTGSRRNIHRHYDIGNDFYARWLDGWMQYTCAYFPSPGLSLEQAQVAKMHHVCRKLELQPGQTVVEAGCGWGGLARFMARYYGVRVRAFNISEEQVKYAREQAARDGLADQVEFVLDDYREIKGQYDVFVSVGMLEHVGVRFYPQLGAVVDRCLKAHGRGLIHSIGRNRPRSMNAWIDKRIFPGAQPPSLAQMMGIFEPYNLSVLDVENLRLHYATTLQQWLQRYDDSAESIRSNYDEFFFRAWRLYLAGSVAAFLTGSLQLFQVVFARGQDNELPWSRAHIYDV